MEVTSAQIIYLTTLALMGCGVLASGGETAAMSNISGPVIGIDLGTTFSCVAVMRGSGVEVIPNDQGNRITPSYVAFTEQGRLIGEAAKHEAAQNPSQTFYDIKRLIGRRFADNTVQEDMKVMPFKILEDDGKLKVEVQTGGATKRMRPEEISAMVLSRLKESAEAFLGESVKHAVITVPAYFNNAQREATKDAGALAGLEVLRLVNEPTAAAIAYGLDKKDEANILVYDLGGGTFDVSLLVVASGVIEVLATNGDTHLGGEDFDQRVADHLKQLFEEQSGKDISKDQRALSKLRSAAEKAKIKLSSTREALIEIENLADGVDLLETLSRAKFEELNVDLFKQTLGPVKRVLEDGKLKKNEIDQIVLVGGSTRIPKVQDLLKAFFNGKQLNRGLNPDEAVAYGAAVQAGVLSGVSPQDVVLLDVTPISIGIETNGGLFDKMINRNSAIPVKKTKTFETSHPNTKETNIVVYEGERRLVKDNNKLGSFKLGGFPEKGPRGVQHDVTLEIDANGIMTVSAKILSSGKEQKMTITKDNQRLSTAEIEEMIQHAELYMEDDQKEVDRQQKYIDLEHFHTDTKLRMEGGKVDLTPEEKEAMETALKEMEDFLQKKDTTEQEIAEKFIKITEDIGPVLDQYKAEEEAEEKEAAGEGDSDGESEDEGEEVDPDAEPEDDPDFDDDSDSASSAPAPGVPPESEL